MCAQRYGLWDNEEERLPSMTDGDEDGRKKSQEHEEEDKASAESILKNMDTEMKHRGKV